MLINRRELCRRLGERAEGRGIVQILETVSLISSSPPSLASVSLVDSNSIKCLPAATFFFISDYAAVTMKVYALYCMLLVHGLWLAVTNGNDERIIEIIYC